MVSLFRLSLLEWIFYIYILVFKCNSTIETKLYVVKLLGEKKILISDTEPDNFAILIHNAHF